MSFSGSCAHCLAAWSLTDICHRIPELVGPPLLSFSQIRAGLLSAPPTEVKRSGEAVESVMLPSFSKTGLVVGQ